MADFYKVQLSKKGFNKLKTAIYKIKKKKKIVINANKIAYINSLKKYIKLNQATSFQYYKTKHFLEIFRVIPGKAFENIKEV